MLGHWFCLIIVQGAPIMQPPLNPSAIYYDSINGLILQRVESADIRNRFEYSFNFTLHPGLGDDNVKCGKITEKEVSTKAWARTMLTLR